MQAPAELAHIVLISARPTSIRHCSRSERWLTWTPKFCCCRCFLKAFFSYLQIRARNDEVIALAWHFPHRAKPSHFSARLGLAKVGLDSVVCMPTRGTFRRLISGRRHGSLIGHLRPAHLMESRTPHAHVPPSGLSIRYLVRHSKCRVTSPRAAEPPCIEVPSIAPIR